MTSPLLIGVSLGVIAATLVNAGVLITLILVIRSLEHRLRDDINALRWDTQRAPRVTIHPAAVNGRHMIEH